MLVAVARRKSVTDCEPKIGVVLTIISKVALATHSPTNNNNNNNALQQVRLGFVGLLVRRCSGSQPPCGKHSRSTYLSSFLSLALLLAKAHNRLHSTPFALRAAT